MLCIRHLAANCYFKKVDKNDATGYTVTKLNAGATLIISKPSETSTPNRIIIQDFSPIKDLSISLTGQAEPAPAFTLSGDFKKQINQNGTTDTSDDGDGLIRQHIPATSRRDNLQVIDNAQIQKLGIPRHKVAYTRMQATSNNPRVFKSLIGKLASVGCAK